VATVDGASATPTQPAPGLPAAGRRPPGEVRRGMLSALDRPLRLGPARWILGLAAAALVGLAAASSVPWVLAGIAAVAALYAFGRARNRAELTVGLFWVAFGGYYTAFAGTQIGGFFYPFYVAFFVTVLVKVVRHGLRSFPPVVWCYLALMLIVLLSLLWLRGGVDFTVLNLLLVYAFGALIPLQFGDRRGLRVVAGWATAAGLVVAVWTIVEAAKGGFGYRADIRLDQNVVSFFVGLSAVLAGAYLTHWIGRWRTTLRLLGLAVLFGVMVYAMLLLASRGMAIALVLAMLALVARALRDDRRKLLLLVALGVLVGVGLLLPGGQGLLQRFHGPKLATANARTPIWRATVESYASSSVPQMLLGHGFDGSRVLVRQKFGSLSSTHEAYLEFLYNYGLLGLGAFVLLHLLLLWDGLRIRGPDGYLMVAMIVFLLVADLSLNAPDGFMYWTALGYVLATRFVAGGGRGLGAGRRATP